MGINVQVCWEKFANYWDVEMRLVPMEGDRLHMNAEEAVKLCDENTIGVVPVLGSTFDGSYEPVKEICDALDDLAGRAPASTSRSMSMARRARSSRRSSTPASSGTSGCRVSCRSIRSGHKYGLVYPGVGLGPVAGCRPPAGGPDLLGELPGRQHADVRAELLSPGAQIVAQYYNFLRLGFDGYKGVQGYAREVATSLSAASPSSARSSC